MNILVTGAVGFIGQALVRDLCARHYKVFCLDCLQDKQSFTGLPIKGFFLQDISQPFHLDQPFDYVFHLGALNITHVGSAEYEAYDRVNVQGTENLIKAVKTRKFVFMSTAKVYQKRPGIIDEESPVGPAGDYERSKLAAEEICRKYFNKHDLTILRSVNIVGAGQAEKAVIPVFFKGALEHKPLDIIYSSNTSLQMLDVRDLVKIFSLLVERGEGLGTLNLCSNETVTLRELAEQIVDLCESKSELRFANNDEVPFSKVISWKIQIALAWQPQISIERILRDYHKFISTAFK